MRTSQILAVTLIVGAFAVGCGDRAPGAPVAPGTPDAAAASLRAQTAGFLAAHTNINTPSGVTLEPLARGSFPHPIDAQFKFRYDRAMQVVQRRDLSDVVMARLTIAEGGSVGWHRHPGSAIVVVRSGTFGVIEETDCVLRTYGPGQVAFHRGGGILDVGFNAGQGEMVAYVTFLGTPAGHAPTVGVSAAEAPCGTP